MPPLWLSKLPGAGGSRGDVLTVHCVVWMLAAKLPLLCAQAADDPNKANVTTTRPGSANLVIIEPFFMIIYSPVGSVP